MRNRSIQCVIYETYFPHFPADPPLALPPSPTKKQTKKPTTTTTKQTNWICIICHPLNGHTFKVSSCSTHTALPSRATSTRNNPSIGIFVKIHFQESLKLELYDLYYRSYSLSRDHFFVMRIVFTTIVCWVFLGCFCLWALLHPSPPDNGHRVGEHY